MKDKDTSDKNIELLSNESFENKLKNIDDDCWITYKTTYKGFCSGDVYAIESYGYAASGSECESAPGGIIWHLSVEQVDDCW